MLMNSNLFKLHIKGWNTVPSSNNFTNYLLRLSLLETFLPPVIYKSKNRQCEGNQQLIFLFGIF